MMSIMRVRADDFAGFHRAEQSSARGGWCDTAASCKPCNTPSTNMDQSDCQQIHLHGHDFAILHYSKENHLFNPREFALSCADNKDLICDNPPRRDVVVVPPGGFAVIAFKTDNPGSWLMHCHIAFHASNGLALQILERLPDARRIYATDKPNIQAVEQGCEEWTPWWNAEFKRGQIQDDSGI